MKKAIDLKKLTAFILAAALMVSVVSCSSDNDSDEEEEETTTVETTEEETTTTEETSEETTTSETTTEATSEFVSVYTPDITEVDTFTYSKDSYSGEEITNQLDDAKGEATYLTRNDWVGTFPTHDGTASAQISTWGNEINGDDGASYTYTKTASDDLIAQLDSFDSGTTVDPETLSDTEIVYDKDVSKVSAVGAGMASNPGVAADMFEALYNANINIQMISTSEIKISVLIDKKDADKAVNAVHDAFLPDSAD